jgi:hypothetical protein
MLFSVFREVEQLHRPRKTFAATRVTQKSFATDLASAARCPKSE